jgi:ribosomal-protein-alanine N-acetyltransferase
MLQHKGTKTLITPRLILRKYQLDDANDMFINYLADERVALFMSWQAYRSIDEVYAFLAEKPKLYESNSTYDWAIEHEGEVIGGISAYSISEKNHSCEFGYCIGNAFWNMGLASEAAYAVINFLFQEVQLHRITATHDVENPASGKVMQKCGMVCEGRFREHYLRHDNTFSDALLYGILNPSYTA